MIDSHSVSRPCPVTSLLIAAVLLAILPAALAETFTINGTVTRSNGGHVLDGNDEIIINKGARIEVNRSSTPVIDGEPNTGVILRKSRTNSPNNTVRNNGDIISTGDFGEGVSVIDNVTSGNRLFNNGNISAVGRKSRGVVLGQNSRLVNNGTITLTDDSTTDDPATGVLVGSNSTITNNGTIKSQDMDGAVVFNSTSGSIGGSTLNNNAGGRIIQRALRNGLRSGPAVSFAGDNNTLNNAGLIDQQGNEIAILFSNGNNNIFKNSGTITTSADNGGAAVEFNASSSTGNTIDNLKGGRIITKGNAAHGIRAGSNNKTITNAGAITTEGLSAYGIYIDANNTVVNHGTITTTGPFASAISVARGNTITNSKSGRITTTGESSHGIAIAASGSGETTITNSGAISVTGRNAHAISTNRGNSTITNHGTLSSRNGDAVNLSGNNNTVTNHGRLLSHSGHALNFKGANNTVNLSTTSFIVGKINTGTNATVNITPASGPMGSALWEFNGGLANNRLHFPAGGNFFYNPTTQQVATFDPSLFAAAANMLGDLTGSLSALTDQRFHHTTRGPWLAAHGGWSDYAGRNATSDQDFDYYSAALGYDFALNHHTLLGLLAGYSDANLTIKAPAPRGHHYKSDLSGPFAGLYAQRRAGPFFLNVLLAWGVFEQEMTRFINDNRASSGLAEVKASPDNWWLSPQLQLGMDYALGQVRVSPSVQVRYAFQKADDYRESGGSAARAEVEKREIEVLQTRLQLGLGRDFKDAAIHARLGWQHREERGDDEVRVRLLGQSRDVGFDSRLGSNFYAGGEVQFKVAGGLLLNLSGEGVFGSQRYRNVHGLISLSKPF